MKASEQESNTVVVLEKNTYLQATSAEFDMRISTAKRYPRDITTFKENLRLAALIDPPTAKTMYYTLEYGKDDKATVVEGASIRLAEIAVIYYKNLFVESYVSDIGDRYVDAIGTALDMESNLAVRVAVKRRITDKYGNRYPENLILSTCAAACSIAYRNAALKVIPKAFIDPIFEAAKRRVIEDNRKDLPSRVARCLEVFSLTGVTQAQILKKLNREKVEQITAEDLARLEGFRTAIKEKIVTAKDVFEQQEKENSTSDINELARKASEKSANKEEVKLELENSYPDSTTVAPPPGLE